MCENSVRKKSRTISEELYENYLNKSETHFDVCGSLEKLNSDEERMSSVVSSTGTLVSACSPCCAGDSCKVCVNLSNEKK